MPKRTRAAAGFSIGSAYLSGHAGVVLLRGSAATAHLVDRRSVALSDPAVPESRQAYHDENGALRRNGPELSRLVTSVKQFGRQSVTDVIDRYQHKGYQLEGIAITVGTSADPRTFENERMRSYALEQQLFRRVIQEACAQRLVPCVILSEQNLHLHELVLPAFMKHPGLRSLVTRRSDLTCSHPYALFAAWLVLADELSLRELIGAIRTIR